MKKEDKNCRYLNLYPEDFDYIDTWKKICDSVGVGYDTKGVTIFYDKTLTTRWKSCLPNK